MSIFPCTHWGRWDAIPFLVCATRQHIFETGMSSSEFVSTNYRPLEQMRFNFLLKEINVPKKQTPHTYSSVYVHQADWWAGTGSVSSCCFLKASSNPRSTQTVERSTFLRALQIKPLRSVMIWCTLADMMLFHTICSQQIPCAISLFSIGSLWEYHGNGLISLHVNARIV